MRLRLTADTPSAPTAVLVLLVSSLPVVPPAAAEPLPLGTFTPTSAVPRDCPPGFTCSAFEVAVPGVDRGMQALGGDYYNRLLQAGSPMVS